jgi:hypothetical protein
MADSDIIFLRFLNQIQRNTFALLVEDELPQNPHAVEDGIDSVGLFPEIDHARGRHARDAHPSTGTILGNLLGVPMEALPCQLLGRMVEGVEVGPLSARGVGDHDDVSTADGVPVDALELRLGERAGFVDDEPEAPPGDAGDGLHFARRCAADDAPVLRLEPGLGRGRGVFDLKAPSSAGMPDRIL